MNALDKIHYIEKSVLSWVSLKSIGTPEPADVNDVYALMEFCTARNIRLSTDDLTAIKISRRDGDIKKPIASAIML